jgi:hypothetical protein
LSPNTQDNINALTSTGISIYDYGEQCDAPKSRFGRFLTVSFLAATPVIAVATQ